MRYVKLAKMQQIENEIENARQSYLEAASIYVLQAELSKDKVLLKKANWSYRKSREVIGKKQDVELSKQELAKRTLEELEENILDPLKLIEQEIENV